MAAITALTTKATVTFPGSVVVGTSVARRLAPNLFRLEIDLGEAGTVEQGFDGSLAWSTDPHGGPRILAGREREQVLWEAGIGRDLRLLDGFDSTEVVGDTTVAGTACWEVHASNADTRLIACFEKETGLLRALRRDITLRGSTQPASVTMLEYAWHDCGDTRLRLPSRMEVTSADRAMTVELTSVDCTPIEGSVFAPPPAVLAVALESKGPPPPSPPVPPTGQVPARTDGGTPSVP